MQLPHKWQTCTGDWGISDVSLGFTCSVREGQASPEYLSPLSRLILGEAILGSNVLILGVEGRGEVSKSVIPMGAG